MPKRSKKNEEKEWLIKLTKSLGLPKSALVIREKTKPKEDIIVVDKPEKRKKYILEAMELDEPEEQMELESE